MKPGAGSRRYRQRRYKHLPTVKPTAGAPTGDPAEDERRYFHDVGIASRIRVHRDLAAAGVAPCPYCREDLSR